MMPTGYTAGVVDGSITTLREYATQCARGMGALVMMRDLPLDAPIPERFEPSRYNADRLAEVQAKLAELRAMKPAEWQTAAEADYQVRIDRFEKWKADRAEQRRRYAAMIDLVRPWEDAPEGIKSFMLEQLQRGMEFDCPAGDRYYESLDRQTAEEWKETREQTLMKESAYHAKANQEEIDRTEGRNAWIAHLRAALPLAVEASAVAGQGE